jgi:hypothetical protein
MIHPRVNAGPLERRIDMVGPTRSPMTEQFATVELAGFGSAQPSAGGLPHGEHDVRVVLTPILAFLWNGSVDGDVRHHAAVHESLLDEV